MKSIPINKLSRVRKTRPSLCEIFSMTLTDSDWISRCQRKRIQDPNISFWVIF
ncbi:UNVERIFIED_CONTAM: hypothetical protein FKN15_013736 [Acipenser sinensis]